MRLQAALPVLILYAAALAQSGPRLTSQAETKTVTVPLTLSHDRLIIDVGLSLPDGSTRHVAAWVDNGNPDLCMSRRLATLLGLAVNCDEKSCSAPPPPEITIGSMKIPLTAVKEVKIPLKPVAGAAVMFPGMPAEINIPSTILRNYDVLIDFPGHQFSIAQPGGLKFNGVPAKVSVNLQNGLIQVPSQIENKKYSLALDLGSSISFLSGELFDKLLTGHPDWPHLTGAVGPANISGSDDEVNRKLMRLERLQYGPLFLTDVAVAD